MICKSIHSWGRVQGVGFRATVKSTARHYDVTGFVQNLPDRQVRVVVAGEASEIDRFVNEIAEQMAGYIQGHRIDDEPEQSFSSFEIRY